MSLPSELKNCHILKIRQRENTFAICHGRILCAHKCKDSNYSLQTEREYNKTAINDNERDRNCDLFRSTWGMEQVEHSEQDSRVMTIFLFHLFRLFLSFHGTEQNKAAILADISVPLVPLVPHRGWNGTNMHGRKDQVREARELREMREYRLMET